MAYGLYTHIQSNRRRSIALLIGLFFLVYVMTFAGALLAEAVLAGDASLDWLLRAALRDLVAALPWVTIGTLIWLWIAYKFHQKMIDALTGGHEVTRQEQPRIYNLLENMCISRGITMPKLKIMESPALNAFATGLNEKQYSITVTSGLVDRLDDAELEAVLGHELTHIRNGDVRMLVDRGRSWRASSRSSPRWCSACCSRAASASARGSRSSSDTQGLRRRGDRHRHRGGDDGGGVAALDRHPLRAVAPARIPRRRRRGRAHQEPRRHDHGAAQDRRAAASSKARPRR